MAVGVRVLYVEKLIRKSDPLLLQDASSTSMIQQPLKPALQSPIQLTSANNSNTSFSLSTPSKHKENEIRSHRHMASHKIASVAEIVTQPEAHIREILRALCADNEIRAKASRILSDLENGTQLVPGGLDNGLKRNLNAMQGGVKICVNCDQQFREDDNNDMKCCYHECE